MHLPAIYATSHIDHEKNLNGFLFLCTHMVLFLWLQTEHSTQQPIWAARDLLLTTREQVSHPYHTNLYSPPLFPPLRQAGHMWIAVKA